MVPFCFTLILLCEVMLPVFINCVVMSTATSQVSVSTSSGRVSESGKQCMLSVEVYQKSE